MVKEAWAPELLTSSVSIPCVWPVLLLLISSGDARDGEGGAGVGAAGGAGQLRTTGESLQAAPRGPAGDAHTVYSVV
jgi:hypothetical protein